MYMLRARESSLTRIERYLSQAPERQRKLPSPCYVLDGMLDLMLQLVLSQACCVLGWLRSAHNRTASPKFEGGPRQRKGRAKRGDVV